MNETKAFKINGFLTFLFCIILLVVSIYFYIKIKIFSGFFTNIIFLIVATSITIVQPNQAKAVTFFGKYIGSIKESGVWMTVPFSLKKNVSLRVRNFNSNKLKVNDINGNPIEIAAVIVFKVVDTAKALYEVDDYEQFVEIQSETALRHISTKYPYDNYNDEEISLRANSEEIANELSKELQHKLSLAGVEVIEARLTHLAYATEIASAMLQRQQASAIVSARQKIVEGAVGMAQMAIEQLERDHIVELDEERKIAMINNLMVSIVSDKGSQPIINTGSLY